MQNEFEFGFVVVTLGNYNPLLTHITSLVVYLQLPVAVWGFTPGVHRHEGPLIEARARVVMGAARGEGADA